MKMGSLYLYVPLVTTKEDICPLFSQKTASPPSLHCVKAKVFMIGSTRTAQKLFKSAVLSTICGKIRQLKQKLKKIFDLLRANHYYAPRCQRGLTDKKVLSSPRSQSAISAAW